ncbi:hypothetical protein BOTBODRAFT_183714 [Botryobasidium botryosum FD-172 SS1]|uniref:Uncharacterized protein n=1 Tax=Botryobasidium botryosum (strain FD-172 SS1) TaxID=930990 RepID=A0A067MZK7_BOTB1|nr:hypothetical protein BOTBODRAFT_183714 [Botryobasidium botryosum FD-172 SS1]
MILGIEGSIPPTATLIGIGMAIGGNVVISLALNFQKLAHKRLQSESHVALQDVESRPHDVSRPSTPERSPLRPVLAVTPRRPGVYFPQNESPSRTTRSRLVTSIVIPEDVEVTEVRERSPPNDDPSDSDDSEKPPNNDTDYLKSKLWWLGFLLLNVGELGNFISYAFAPASVVAPLGTVALIANCIFAPLLLKERFHKRDLFGMFLAICGAVTVVIASKSSDVRFDMDGLIKAISQPVFIVYAGINVLLAIILAFLAQRPIANESVFIDIGLCAIFGGFTVLSTKGVSTLISIESFEVFKLWITYPIALVLLGTGLGQIRYLNRALMKFDSKTVIPTQFVLFNLSAIIGSAVLYRDFESISYHRFIDFLYGCITTFLGVFFLTRPTLPKLSIFESESNPGTPEESSAPPSPTAATPLLPKVITVTTTTPVKSRPRKSSSASLVLSPAAQYVLLSTSPTSANTPGRVRAAGTSASEWTEREPGSFGRRAGARYSA